MYEEAISMGMENGKFQYDDSGQDNEFDLKLDELQQLIDAKKWDGSPSTSSSTPTEDEGVGNQDHES